MPINLPPVRDAADLAGTMSAIIAAAAEGAISPDEGGRLARLVEIFLRAVETGDFERRLQLLEVGLQTRLNEFPDHLLGKVVANSGMYDNRSGAIIG